MSNASANANANAVSVFQTPDVQGEVLFCQRGRDTTVHATFHRLPKGEHGFHLHKAGDLRGEGCAGACEHYDKGHHRHGGAPSKTRKHQERHTGDLGNIRCRKGKPFKRSYVLKGVRVSDLYGRSVIVHADRDDLGRGTEEDSATTGHSGKRIACALIGRVLCEKKKTRKSRK